MGDELKSGEGRENVPEEQASAGGDGSQAGEAHSTELDVERWLDVICPVVGIGASAGGLAAVERFLTGMTS